jgi:hypothetical protein
LNDHINDGDILGGSSVVFEDRVTDEQKTYKESDHEEVLKEEKALIYYLRADVSA